MKKLFLYIAVAVAGLSIESCKGDYTDWAEPQSHAQEDAVTIPGFSASATAPIDLNTLAAEEAATFTLSGSTLPEGYTLTSARIELSANDKPATTVETTLDGNAPVAQLQKIVTDAFGRRPDARNLMGHVYVSAIKNGQAAFIDAGTITVTVTPKAPVIESAYYIVGNFQTVAEKSGMKQR